MPPKLNVPSETSSTKNSVKTKKRISKTKRNSKSSVKSKDSTINNKKLENKRSTNLISNMDNPKGNYSNGSYSKSSYSSHNNVHTSLSDIMINGMDRIDDTANNKINSDSYCRYQCSCRALKKCKEKLDFNLLTHNGIPVKLMYQGSEQYKPNKIYTINSNNSIHPFVTKKISAHENLYSSNSNKRSLHDWYKSSPTNIERKISHDSFNSYNSQYNFNQRNSQLLPKVQSNISTNSKCSACLNCQHSKTSIKKCSSISLKQSQSCKCNCIYCRKISPMRCSPSRSARNSFSSSQSCPQLDAIKEEDTENEDIQNKSHRSSIESESKPTPTITLKKQKTLEDSCADFLNIVCDNILESVQKSIDCKLKEFDGQSTEKLEILCEKLDKNETMMRSYCSEMMKKMTEQNNSNFQKIYSLIKNLMETKLTNQYPVASKTYQDNECQYELEIKEEKDIIKEHFDDKINGVKDAKNEKDKTKGCGCCHCSIEEKHNHTLELHKSYTNSMVKENLSNENKRIYDAHLEEIKTAGFRVNENNNSVSKDEDKANMADIIKYPSQEVAIPQIPYTQETNEEIRHNEDLPLKFPPLEVIPSNNNSFPKGLTSKSQAIVEDFKIMNLPEEIESFSIENVSLKNLTPRQSFSKLESKQEDLKIIDVAIKYSAIELNSSKTSLVSEKAALNPEFIFSSPADKSLQNYNIFSPTASGKITNNINGSTKDINSAHQRNFPNLYENYDTSGYATEPEDNNDNVNSISGRKKLQKKASKQHCNSPQSSSSVTLQIINQGSRQNNLDANTRRLSKTHSPNDNNSSPTRLSRL